MDLKALKERARTAPHALFAAEYPGLLLAVVPSPDDATISFQTAEVEVGRRTLRAQPAEIEVLPLAKAPENPYPDRISVGRARNCDVVLRFSSVSKLHAHIRLLGGTSVEVTDLGSQNGTSLNGRPLATNEPERVVVGDVLIFGAITAHFVDAEHLRALVLGMPDPEPPP